MTNLKTFVYIAATLMLLYFISTIKVDNTRQIATIVFDDAQQDPYDTPKTIAQQTKEKVMWCKKDKDCSVLAEAGYYEARGESDMGVVSVMHTILNRVQHKSWPNTVHGVVHKYKHFSYLTDGSVQRGMRDDKQVERLSVLAFDVLHGEIESPVVGVTHYHSVKVNPYWVHDVEYVAHVGNHIFYRGDR